MRFSALSDKVFDQIARGSRAHRSVTRMAAAGVMAIAAAATVHYYTVRPGDTLSSIAQSVCGSAGTWTGIYQQNTGTLGGNPNLIFAGQHLQFQCNAGTVTTELASSNQAAPVTQSAAQPGGAPGSFQACVISRESGGNPEAVNATSDAGGLYQFLPSTWAQLGFASSYPGGAQTAPVSVQNQAFQELYATAGQSPWAPYDGC